MHPKLAAIIGILILKDWLAWTVDRPKVPWACDKVCDLIALLKRVATVGVG